METNEPYRATRLWNEVIAAFQNGMPLKKHRRIMHNYDSCFTASEGVTWLHCYLLNNPNFGPEVTRQQTINLLQKFLKCRVIDCVNSKSKKIDFSDNSQLYRFIPVTPKKTKTIPLRLIQTPSLCESNKKRTGEKCKDHKGITNLAPLMQKENLPECCFVEKKISVAEIENIWKTVSMNMLEGHLTCPLSDIVEEKSINGHIISHNVCRISKTGVVTLIDKTDDVPHWVISAMKCLANWPNAIGSGSCLPNYPGFEKDVFKVVKDYFLNPQVPLIPPPVSSILLHIFYLFTEKKETSLRETKVSPKIPSAPSPAIKTSTPVNDSESAIICPVMQCIENDGKLLLDDPEVMWDYPSSVLFETDFATSNPVTRMVTDKFSHDYLSKSCSYPQGSMESISTISVCSLNQKSIFLEDHQIVNTPLKAWNSELLLSNEQHSKISNKIYPQGMRSPICEEKPKLKQSYSMCDIYVDGIYDNETNNLNTSIASTKTIRCSDPHISFDMLNITDVKQNLYNKDHASTVFCQNKSSSPFEKVFALRGSNQIQNVSQLKSEKSCTPDLKAACQLILLFLPPPNRRQLHLLLRVINKILRNGKFTLDVSSSMREYLLQTFLPAVIQSDLNESILIEILSYILDNCEAVFKPPVGLKEEVEKNTKLRSGKIVYSVDDTCNLTYCELVSKQQYEEQKVTVLNEALKSLLDDIMQNKNFTQKERKRRIKQFRENHPEVYYNQFPHELKAKTKVSLLNKITRSKIRL